MTFIVILKETGKLVALTHRGEFDKNFHQMVDTPAEPTAPIVESSLDLSDDSKARFEELKAMKAWLVSKPKELREEYSKLKAIHG